MGGEDGETQSFETWGCWIWLSMGKQQSLASSGLSNFVYYLGWAFHDFLFIAVNEGQVLQPLP